MQLSGFAVVHYSPDPGGLGRMRYLSVSSLIYSSDPSPGAAKTYLQHSPPSRAFQTIFIFRFVWRGEGDLRPYVTMSQGLPERVADLLWTFGQTQRKLNPALLARFFYPVFCG